MSDSKVSDLTAATSTGGSDLLYVVQSGLSKKATLSTIFNNAGNATLQGNTSFGSAVQLLSSPGIVDVSKTVTHLSIDAVGGIISIPTGKLNQIKVLTVIGSAGGTYTVNANVANNANISLTNNGHTATLLFTNNKWFFIGGTANLA
jgi:proline racemase